ncbi:integrase catalytic domain-containing protein [Trichonephila clavata]|uniref:Integrase catalytic domain-containing protein n=1 Tax=Trichonephila clavata TaxID=2740835 RepID=A0A8X6HD44_TRICU|nr:integrase catalytic domain-containing protein [Trichonephila clavata]
MFLMGNSSIEVIDLDLCDFAKFQRRVKFRAKLLKNLRGRFRKEYLGLLVQKAHKTSRAFKVGEIVLIENPNKKRLYWPLGKVVELIPGRDGKVRTLKLRCSNSEIIRPIQRVFPLEIQSAETTESDDVPLDADAPKVPSATLDVSESTMIPVDAPLNLPKMSRYGRTIRRPKRLSVFNVTTIFESE